MLSFKHFNRLIGINLPQKSGKSPVKITNRFFSTAKKQHRLPQIPYENKSMILTNQTYPLISKRSMSFKPDRLSAIKDIGFAIGGASGFVIFVLGSGFITAHYFPFLPLVYVSSPMWLNFLGNRFPRFENKYGEKMGIACAIMLITGVACVGAIGG